MNLIRKSKSVILSLLLISCTVKDDAYSSKTYYGATFGLGFEGNTGRRRNKIFCGFYLPQRSNEFDRDLKALQQAGFKKQNTISSVTISLGFKLNRNYSQTFCNKRT